MSKPMEQQILDRVSAQLNAIVTDIQSRMDNMDSKFDQRWDSLNSKLDTVALNTSHTYVLGGSHSHSHGNQHGNTQGFILPCTTKLDFPQFDGENPTG